jgi:predicted PurR-regulated permease PerM
VVKGILGVAIIQTTMAALGFFIAGVPFAGLWTILCLILAIIQIGVGSIAIPVVIYMFSVSDTTTAIILAIWLGITLLADNILKPILLGRNAPAPMLVIFLGSIGGFIYNGFIGLFLGAIVLTIEYKLFLM